MNAIFYKLKKIIKLKRRIIWLKKRLNLKYYFLDKKKYNDDLSEEDIKYLLKKRFKWRTGYELNFDNPRSFNEKLNWLKLYDHNPLMTICADKYKVRDYYCKKIENGEDHLVQQYGVYDNETEINFEKLPNAFVLKSNWGSGKQIIVKDKSKLDIENCKKEIGTWLDIHTNHYYRSFEWGYKNIVPKIVCEKFLDFEYKLEFLCFNGKPRFFWIVLNDKTNKTQANFYELNWTKMPFSDHYPNFDQTIAKPNCYEEILNIAEKLCKDFLFVRCDFFITQNSYKFSEMTFFHWGGMVPFEPREWDYKIGDMLDLKKDN